MEWAVKAETTGQKHGGKMYCYIRSEPGLWTVGFYRPDGSWNPESDHSHEGDAAQRVHLLNGGGKHAPMREIGVAVKCESCGRWFNATSQEQMDSKCPNCGGDFYLFKRQSALDDD